MSAVPVRSTCSIIESSIFTPKLSMTAFRAAMTHWFTPCFSVQLWVHGASDEMDAISLATIAVLNVCLAHEINAEALALGTYPGHGQADNEVHIGTSEPGKAQFTGDGHEGQDVENLTNR